MSATDVAQTPVNISQSPSIDTLSIKDHKIMFDYI